jgi:hypothetical protein
MINLSTGVYIAIIFVLLYTMFSFLHKSKKIDVRASDGNIYEVADFPNKLEAAELIASVNAAVIKLLKYMRDKYTSGNLGGTTDRELVTLSMLNNFNFEKIIETDPRYESGTSTTLNKGEKMYICVRQRPIDTESAIYKSGYDYPLCDYNTVLFVVIHELSHIAAYDTWFHTTRFWEVFKFVLKNAVELGIYQNVDYSKNPRRYCGLIVNYNPLFDSSLREIR